MNILVTGHKGMLGSRLFQFLKDQGKSVYGYDLPEGDLLNEQQLKSEILKNNIKRFINT